MLIRRAYAAIKKQQQRKFTGIIAGVLVLLVLTLGLAVYQEIKNQRQEAFAEELFAEMKRQELATAQLRYSLLGDADPNEKLAAIEEGRRRVAGRFDAYVEELGLRRRLNPEEQLIHKTARIFHESEFSMPGPFVRAVRDEIRNYWLTPSGRARFSQAIQRAEQHGYTEVIVRAMQQYGLPPEFFYLALHESDFDKDARGPKTRWGIAKGMWQFIPSTGQEYGLQIGPREDERVPDPDDERHDVQKATDAAARYLLYIYSFDFDNPLLPYMEQASTEARWTPRLSGSPIATGRRANWF